MNRAPIWSQDLIKYNGQVINTCFEDYKQKKTRIELKKRQSSLLIVKST